MDIYQQVKKEHSRIKEIGNKYGVTNVRLFGSVARGEATQTSDIDLLVTVERNRNFFEFVAFCQEVEALFDQKVDVVTDKGLSPYLRDQICQEAKPL